MYENTKRNRRRFLSTIAMTVLASACMISSVQAQSAPSASASAPISQVASNDPWGPLKHVHAGVLDVAYAEMGPADGPVVILLHGWPYDIHSYEQVAPALAAKGYRVLVPYARGYGETRFLSASTMRNAEPAALAQDVIDFMDALHIKRAVFGGIDWGARSADIVAALWPERV
jgi:predicted alpha/beta-fold hydrolase